MTDDYPTDKWIKILFDGWYDPCSLSNGELRMFDGLGSSWKDKTFVNPPYSKPLPWVEYAIEENKRGKTIALLLKADTSTKLYAKLIEADAHIIFIHKRLQHQTGKPANFPSMIAILYSDNLNKQEAQKQ